MQRSPRTQPLLGDAQSGLGKGTVPRPSNTVWLGLSLFHFVMADLYDRPVIWNPIYTAHVFNPHAGYLTVDESNVNNSWELA